MARVSVIMPVFNAAPFLKDSIGSILNQTFSDFELILINDGSTDRSAEIIQSIKDDRIFFINNNENQGTAVVSNLGLGKAQGEFIALMDADDFSMPDRFQKQVEFFDAHPEVGILGTGSIYSDTKKSLNYPATDEQIRKDMFFYYPFRNPTLMLRSDVIRTNKLLFNTAFKHTLDYEFISRLIGYTKAANLNEPLLIYSVHQNQISTLQDAVFRKHADIVSLNMLSYLGISLDEKSTQLFVRLRNLIGDEFPSFEEMQPLREAIKRGKAVNPLFNCITGEALWDRINPIRKKILLTQNPELWFLIKHMPHFGVREIVKYSIKSVLSGK